MENNFVILRQYRQSLKSKGRAKRTILDRVNMLRRFLKAYPDTDLLYPKIQDIAGYLSQKPLAITTRYSRYCNFLVFYKWMMDELKILVNPMWKVPAVPVPKKIPKRIMTQGETTKLLNHFSDDPKNLRDFTLRTMLEVMYACSLRQGELIGLNVEDYCPATSSLRVRPEITKTRTGRIVPIGKIAMSLLNRYLKEVRPVIIQQQEKRNTRYKKTRVRYLEVEKKAIFLSFFATRISANVVQRLFLELQKTLRLRSNPSSHSMRKSSATHMLRNHAPLIQVAKLLGHADCSATMVYTKVYALDLVKMTRAHHPREKQKNYSLPKLDIPPFLKDDSAHFFNCRLKVLKDNLAQKHPREREKAPLLKLPECWD